MKIYIALMLLVVFSTVFANAQDARRQLKESKVQAENSVKEKYAEVSALETRAERQNWIRRQTPEMVVALWNHHFDIKIAENDFNSSQLRAIEKVRSNLTPEFVSLAKSSSPFDKAEFIAFNQAMTEAFGVFTKDQINELFYIMGSRTTLKTSSKTVSLLEDEESTPQCNQNKDSWCDAAICSSRCRVNDGGCGCLSLFVCNCYGYDGAEV